MRVGYGRVSTREQDPAYQRQALESAGCERIFCETASGAHRDRPALQEDLAYLREGDIVVVHRLDRLAQSLHWLFETIEGLDARGIDVRSLSESLDTSPSGERLVMQVFGALAEFERSLIRKRTAAGLDYAHSQGRIGGRPAAMSKADKEQARTLLEHSDLAVAEIARRLRISHSTLYERFPGGRAAFRK